MKAGFPISIFQISNGETLVSKEKIVKVSDTTMLREDHKMTNKKTDNEYYQIFKLAHRAHYQNRTLC